MIILLLFAFLSGLVTIFAPCIWPLLPIILSSSSRGGKIKSLGITLGVVISFSFFTLSVSYLVMLFHLDPNILRLIAVVTIAFLGLTMIIPTLLIHYELLISKISSLIGGRPLSQHHGFIGGFIIGLSLGIVWSPCAGPILATIATLAATQAVNGEIILITLVFSLGVGIPLFLFSLAGTFLFQKSKFISVYTEHIQKLFGVLMILTAFAIYTNYDKVIQIKLLNLFPSYSSFLTQLESNSVVQTQLDTLKGIKNMARGENISGLADLGPAPEFAGITHWLNTNRPLTLKSLRGKVVLVDFWTYTCINCLRTLPYITSWYDKYKDKGFVVIGVHTPEFEFEKKTENVAHAIAQYHIRYPVAQDNNYATWNAYSNQYWPAEYLIDVHGNLRRTHFGEGEYDQSEKAIQQLLEEAGNKVNTSLVHVVDQTPRTQLSPETYLGSLRMQYYYPSQQLANGSHVLNVSTALDLNTFSLGGTWAISDEYAMNEKNGVLTYNFIANKVFLVIRPSTSKGSDKVKVYLDGKLVDNAYAGTDVLNGVVTVNQERLYHLIDLHQKDGTHILRLEFETPGTSVYAFTFG